MPEKIDKNMFKEFELQTKMMHIDIDEVETLCDKIYKKIKSMRFIKILYRDIRSEYLKFDNSNGGSLDESYCFVLQNEDKIKLCEFRLRRQVGKWLWFSYQWPDFDVTIKMKLIETLPEFLKSIEKDIKNLSENLCNFLDKFKDINLDNTWKSKGINNAKEN